MKRQLKPVITIGDYIRQERLGRGSFASVYKAEHKVTHEIVAIKDIYIDKMPEKNLEAEISIMREIRHPNIVKFIECIRKPGHVYLVMEYCSLGDLNDYLKENCSNKGMKESDLIHFLSQMGSALKYLRQRNFVHRDIKPQNILLVPSSDSELPTIKISDFGFAKFLPNSSLTTSYCGTPLYMAPEVILRKSYDAKADLWSVGVLIYEMMMGRKICQTNQMSELEDFLRKYKNQVNFSGSQHVFSRELKDLISVLLKKNPIERASCEDFFHHVELLRQSKNLPPILLQEKEQEEEDDDDEYVVVIDMKKSPSSTHQQQTFDHRYSSSAPTTTTSLLRHEERYMVRERKFSVGSAGSVLTKAISKAFFGHSSTSSHGTHSPPSPITPVTPPTIIEEDISILVEEMTLDKLLVSQNNHTLTKENDKYVNHMMEMVEAIESFAHSKLEQSNASPFDFILAEETMVLFLKAVTILDITKDYAKKSSILCSSLDTRRQYNMNLAIKASEHCGKQDSLLTSDLGIESILYNHAVESSCKADILEVTNEDLKGSLHLFKYSILLLEAILQVKDKSLITIEDQHIVKRLIRSIHSRLDVVIAKTNKQ